MGDPFSTSDGLTHLTTLTNLLSETSTSAITSMMTENPTSPLTSTLQESPSSPSNATTTISPAAIGQEVEGDGSHHYPADMLGFTAACAIILAILGTFGNLLTIIALPMTKSLRTTATAFVVNLAVVELLFCVLILPMSGAQYFYLQRHLRGSLLTDTHCIFFTITRYTLTQVELQTILAIAFTRALAVSVPRFYQSINRPKVIGVYIAVIWVYSFSTRIPAAVGVLGQYGYNPLTMECDLDNNKIARLIYLVVDAFIPVLLIFILYFFVFIMVVRRAVVRQRKFSTNFPPPPSQIKQSSARVARASKRSRSTVAPPTSSTSSTSTSANQRKGSSSSLKNLKKMVSETNLRARFLHAATLFTGKCTRQSSTTSQRLTSTRRDMRVARTIFIIFLLVLVCSVPVAVVHTIDRAVTRPVRFLFVHILYWVQYCLNVVVYVLMNRQYRDAYVDCLARVFPRFKRHRGLRFFWEKASISSRPQPNLNSTKPNNSTTAEADPTVAGPAAAASQPRLKAIPEGHSSSAANDSVFSDAQQKTPEDPLIAERKNEENKRDNDSDREDEKEKDDVEGEIEEKHTLMDTEHWVNSNGDTVSQPDCESKV